MTVIFKTMFKQHYQTLNKLTFFLQIHSLVSFVVLGFGLYSIVLKCC